MTYDETREMTSFERQALSLLRSVSAACWLLLIAVVALPIALAMLALAGF